MNIKPPVRPQAHIDRLMAMLEPHATPLNVVARKRLSWEHKGKISSIFSRKAAFPFFVHRTGY